MSSRSSSLGTKTALARLLTQERITGTDEEIAIVHETNRQSTIKEILVHVFLMSKFKYFPSMLTVQKAENQYFTSTDNDQAAHCAPGQIVCGGLPIQKLIKRSDDLEMIVECLFSKTDGIHFKFNQADSRAEGSRAEDNGLRHAFGRACNQVAQAGKFARFNRAFEFYHYIESAYITYKTQGLQAIDIAIQKQRQATEPLKDVTREEIIFILEKYRHTLASSSPSLDTVQALFPEDSWREYAAAR
jgi:hypothetical protein